MSLSKKKKKKKKKKTPTELPKLKLNEVLNIWDRANIMKVISYQAKCEST